MTFEKWYEETYGHQPNFWIEPVSECYTGYIAGWNACRDKWGGLPYEDTVELGLMNDSV